MIKETLTRSCRDEEKHLYILMISVVMLGSIIGNSLICLLLIRFKTLRTVPNILIANLAVIDILNALSNMPLMIMWYICKVPFLKGRSISWFVVTWYVLFMHLTVFNLIVLTMDRYGAIVHGLRYHSWKTINKAKVAVLFVFCEVLLDNKYLNTCILVNPVSETLYFLLGFSLFNRCISLAVKNSVYFIFSTKTLNEN